MEGPERSVVPRSAAAAEGAGGLRAVVTGGAGFIGSRLASSLLEGGASVVIVDDLSSGDADAVARLVDAFPSTARFVHASVLDPRSLDDAMERAQVVFHLAAMASAPASLEQPERCFDVNARGTVEALQAARAAGVRRFVLASSCAVYGDAPTPTREDAPARPLSPYAASKAAAEAAVSAWWSSFGLDGCALRLFNVYGPGQPGQGEESAVAASFAGRAVAGKRPVVFGDGTQTRDFVHVDDAVRAFVLAGTAGERQAGRAVNIGSGEATTVLALARAVAEAAGRGDLKPDFAPGRRGEVQRSQADVHLARATLGFAAEVGLVDGLRSLVEWMRGGAGDAEAALSSR